MIKSQVIRGPTGKMWGKIIDDTYETRRTEDHYCWKHRGYGIQKNVFDQLKARGVNTIKIIVSPLKVYLSDVEKWEKFGKVDTLRREDGEQIFLELGWMNREIPRGLKKLDEFV